MIDILKITVTSKVTIAAVAKATYIASLGQLWQCADAMKWGCNSGASRPGREKTTVT